MEPSGSKYGDMQGHAQLASGGVMHRYSVPSSVWHNLTLSRVLVELVEGGSGPLSFCVCSKVHFFFISTLVMVCQTTRPGVKTSVKVNDDKREI